MCFITLPELLELIGDRFKMSSGHFSLIPLRPSYSESLAHIYADPKAMKYFYKGKTFKPNEVFEMFKKYSKAINFDQNPLNYYWAVLIRDGLCGVISMSATNTEREFEITRLLDPKVHRCKIGTSIFYSLFYYFPDFSWVVTAHPDNKASLASQLAAGFKQQGTSFIAGKGVRIISARPSSASLEEIGYPKDERVGFL